MAKNDMNEQTAPQQDAILMTADQLKDFVGSVIRELGAANKPAGDKVHTRVPAKQKKVHVRLFKDNGKYKDDVFVAVNGRTIMIPRGVDVEVDECFAEALETSMAQDNATEAENLRRVAVWQEKEKEL